MLSSCTFDSISASINLEFTVDHSLHPSNFCVSFSHGFSCCDLGLLWACDGFDGLMALMHIIEHQVPRQKTGGTIFKNDTLLQYTFFGPLADWAACGYRPAWCLHHITQHVAWDWHDWLTCWIDTWGIGEQFYLGGSLYCQILWFFMSLISETQLHEKAISASWHASLSWLSWLLDPLQSLPLASSCFQLSFFLLQFALPKTLSSINPGQALTCHAILLLVWLTPFLAPYRRKLLLAALVLGRFALSEVLLGAAREVPASGNKMLQVNVKWWNDVRGICGNCFSIWSGCDCCSADYVSIQFFSLFFLQRMYGIDSVDGI